MSKTIADPAVEDHLFPDVGWVRMCPKCGSGTSSEYEDHEFMGSGCRECKLLWKCTEDEEGIYTLIGTPYKPNEKTRFYEIRIISESHILRATSKEDARKQLIKKLKIREYDAYGVYVKHLGDDAEVNEGIHF